MNPKFEETLEDENLKCPYCGEMISDSWEYRFDGDTIEIECDCGKKFYGDEIVTRSYKGRANCELNGDKHIFEKVKGFDLRICKICGYYK